MSCWATERRAARQFEWCWRLRGVEGQPCDARDHVAQGRCSAVRLHSACSFRVHVQSVVNAAVSISATSVEFALRNSHSSTCTTQHDSSNDDSSDHSHTCCCCCCCCCCSAAWLTIPPVPLRATHVRPARHIQRLIRKQRRSVDEAVAAT